VENKGSETVEVHVEVDPLREDRPDFEETVAVEAQQHE
jgi:hypothetical protein